MNLNVHRRELVGEGPGVWASVRDQIVVLAAECVAYFALTVFIDSPYARWIEGRVLKWRVGDVEAMVRGCEEDADDEDVAHEKRLVSGLFDVEGNYNAGGSHTPHACQKA